MDKNRTDSDILLSDGSRRLPLLSEQQFDDIIRGLGHLVDSSEALAGLICDSTGLLIASHGTLGSGQAATLATLISANLSATGQVAQIIGEDDGFSMNFYEGAARNIYVCAIDDEYCLAIVFDSKTTFGLLRANTKRALPNFQDAFTIKPDAGGGHGSKPQKSQIQTEEFRSELSEKLDSLLVTED
jgi:predicted regulator of Ras-like GTPase activity (Roadblock/LC7/MglB family)